MCVYNCYVSIYYYLFERHLNQDLGMRGAVQRMHPGVGITSVKFLEGSQMQLLLGRENMCKDRNSRQRRDSTEQEGQHWGLAGLGMRARVGVSCSHRGKQACSWSLHFSCKKWTTITSLQAEEWPGQCCVWEHDLGVSVKNSLVGCKQYHKEPVPAPRIRCAKWVTSAGWRDLEWKGRVR